MITKDQPPRSLVEHRMQPHTDYENYQEMNDLRESLVREQKGLCCYCTGRIRPCRTKMRIEHWKCQADHENLQLDYSNLLGACLGKTGKREHCDRSKGDQDLKWNPANPEHLIENRIRYLNDGTIEGLDDEFDRQLNEVLNLNMDLMKRNREAVYDEVLKWWQSTRNARQKVQNEIEKRSGDAAEYPPFSPVAV